MEDGQLSDHFICANCQGSGKSACKGCLLVLYCGLHCQKAHWGAHKTVCKSSLMKKTWQPQWAVENRTPSFVGDSGPPMVMFGGRGGKKFLWGNMPAIDILRLAANEGDAYEQDLHLLFAASGDLRNVIKTVTSIPESYRNRASSVINDRDFGIIARNLIMLFVALISDDPIEAADITLHIWYSAFIRTADMDFLATRIRPLLEDLNAKIKDKAPGTLLGKTWTFGSRTLRGVFSKEGWRSLLRYLQTPEGLSTQTASKARSAITLAPERLDYRDRKLLTLLPAHRVCDQNFREHGILLPFGQSRSEFCVPNPSLFQGDEWLLADDADPLNSWSIEEVLSTKSGAATNDIYGKLFYYLGSLLRSFHNRLLKNGWDFQLFNLDAKKLSEHLESGKFARIETSNIADAGYMGAPQTVCHLGPLLQNPQENAHATLLTLFINAVQEITESVKDEKQTRSEIERIMPYMSLTHRPRSPYDPQTVLLMSSLSFVTDVDKYFAEYMAATNFHTVQQFCGMGVKAQHTIVDKWPLRLKLKPDKTGAQEEFERLRSSDHSGTERYVEWKKMK